jgi:AAA family ATP:ADP antiporter
MKQLPAFKNIPGNLLSDLTDKINPIDLHTKDKVMFSPTEDTPILIIAHGEVVLKNGEEEIARLKKGAVFGDLFQEGPVPNITSAHAIERSIIFKISLHDFYFVLAKHHDLVQGIIRNITGKKEIVQE